jgi:hypothetical protein
LSRSAGLSAINAAEAEVVAAIARCAMALLAASTARPNHFWLCKRVVFGFVMIAGEYVVVEGCLVVM